MTQTLPCLENTLNLSSRRTTFRVLGHAPYIVGAALIVVASAFRVRTFAFPHVVGISRKVLISGLFAVLVRPKNAIAAVFAHQAGADGVRFALVHSSIN